MPGPKLLFALFTCALVGLFALLVVDRVTRPPEIARRFHVSEGDLRAFIGVTDYSYDDFENSEGVRNCFEKWRRGEGVIGRKTDTVPVVIPISSGR